MKRKEARQQRRRRLMQSIRDRPFPETSRRPHDFDELIRSWVREFHERIGTANLAQLGREDFGPSVEADQRGLDLVYNSLRQRFPSLTEAECVLCAGRILALRRPDRDRDDDQ